MIPINLAILRSSSMEMGTLYFEEIFKIKGYDLTIDFGGYNQYYQEVLNPESFVYKKEYDAIVIFFDFDLDDSTKFLNSINLLRKNTGSPIIIANKIVPVNTLLGIFDCNSFESEKLLIQEKNEELSKFINPLPNTYVFDLNSVAAQVGHRGFFDKRMKYVARSLFTPQGYAAIAKELLKFIVVLKGKTRKCIVLDCDNTLWGGIIGEDGINGIELGEDYPGRCFVDFQKALLDFSKKGFILAINSKNNINDVMEVLRNHPHQILKGNDITVIEANWNNKVDNMRSIAKSLNIGIDSLVFIDDSPLEINLMRAKLPEVLSIDISNIFPEDLPDILYSINELEILSYTKEDKEKIQQYRDQVKREDEKKEYSSIEDYLKSLNMKMIIYKDCQEQLERLTQLTQKTNQFNLTTKRYTESDMTYFLTDKDINVYSFQLEDKFGNNGITGLCIVRKSGNSAIIDTFLMSCRVVERTAEFDFMKQIFTDLKKEGIFNILGVFSKTTKNELVKDLYDRIGFSLENEDDVNKIYKLDLADYKDESKSLIEVVWNQ
ncbi:MAG TPA: HAD-IIIC family phosphatase [Methanofastidiosum sp.]|nr:HAD-IIIC family phosphatase [Methanofastidiosum sp.]